MPKENESVHVTEANGNDNICTFHCKEHYNYENNACEAAQQTVNCTLPAHAEWNPASGGTITQTWTNNNGWQPPAEAIYSETPGTNNQCHYKCESSYFYNSTSKECENPCDSRPCDNIQHSTGVCSASSLEQYECGCDKYYYWNSNCSKIVTLGNICTGQDKCYNGSAEISCPAEGEDFFGQDAHYAANGYCVPKSFEISGSEKTVFDSNLGLEWQQTISDSTYSWEDAVSYCENLTYAGKSDWRLPNKNELITLVNYDRYKPSSDFPDMPNEFFWSSSTYVVSPVAIWFVNFSNGHTNGSYKTITHFSVRCVR